MQIYVFGASTRTLNSSRNSSEAALVSVVNQLSPKTLAIFERRAFKVRFKWTFNKITCSNIQYV